MHLLYNTQFKTMLQQQILLGTLTGIYKYNELEHFVRLLLDENIAVQES